MDARAVRSMLLPVAAIPHHIIVLPWTRRAHVLGGHMMGAHAGSAKKEGREILRLASQADRWCARGRGGGAGRGGACVLSARQNGEAQAHYA